MFFNAAFVFAWGDFTFVKEVSKTFDGLDKAAVALAIAADAMAVCCVLNSLTEQERNHILIV